MNHPDPTSDRPLTQGRKETVNDERTPMDAHASAQRPGDRAYTYLTTYATATLPPEDIAAALRVLRMIETADLGPLERQMTVDGAGNPICDTDAQRLSQATWSAAAQVQNDVVFLRRALDRAHSAPAQ